MFTATLFTPHFRLQSTQILVHQFSLHPTNRSTLAHSVHPNMSSDDQRFVVPFSSSSDADCNQSDNKAFLEKLGSLPSTQRLQTSLPPLWLQKPETRSWLYPPQLKAWHSEIRGADGPPPECITVPGQKQRAVRASPVVVSFRYQEGNQIPDLVCGSLQMPDEVKPNLQYLTMHWFTHSQVPAVRFRCPRALGKPAAFVWIFADCIKRNTESVLGIDSTSRLACVHAIGDDLRQDLGQDRDIGWGHSDPSDADTVWQTTLSMWSEGLITSTSSPQAALQPKRPKVTGIEDSELRQIMNIGDLAPEKGDLSLLSSGEWALWGLLSTKSFTIHRRWPKDDVAREVYNYFTSYMTTVFNSVAEFGNWPHYKRQTAQAGLCFDAFRTDLDNLEPPRNMINEWRVHYVSEAAVRAQPEKWASFPKLTTYPDLETKAFALRVEAARKIGIERSIFLYACITNDGKVMSLSDVAGTGQQPAASEFNRNGPKTRREKNPINSNQTKRHRLNQDEELQRQAKTPRLDYGEA